MSGEPWAPCLADVARHVPTRTRDTKSPGSDKLLMTFNANTTPNDAAVQQMIDDVVATVQAQIGPLTAVAATTPDLATAARTYVEWRVSADIELAYPNRDADIRLYAQLDARATAALTALQAALNATNSGQVDAYPQWAFPAPPPYGDQSPGSGADFIVEPFGVPPSV